MSISVKCSKCGVKGVEAGKLVGWGAHFEPENIKFSASNQTTKILARMCRACGHIELMADVEGRVKPPKRPIPVSATAAKLVRASIVR